MKNVNIMGVHQFLGERGHKKTIHMGNCLKSGAWQIIGRKIFRVGEGCGWYHDAHYELILVRVGT